MLSGGIKILVRRHNVLRKKIWKQSAKDTGLNRRSLIFALGMSRMDRIINDQIRPIVSLWLVGGLVVC